MSTHIYTVLLARGLKPQGVLRSSLAFSLSFINIFASNGEENGPFGSIEVYGLSILTYCQEWQTFQIEIRNPHPYLEAFLQKTKTYKTKHWSQESRDGTR